MNPSKNDFLTKDEDDEDDIYHQICIFIDHRVCNPSLEQIDKYYRFSFYSIRHMKTIITEFGEEIEIMEHARSHAQ